MKLARERQVPAGDARHQRATVITTMRSQTSFMEGTMQWAILGRSKIAVCQAIPCWDAVFDSSAPGEHVRIDGVDTHYQRV